MSDPVPAAAIDAKRYGPWAVIAGGSEGIGACIAAAGCRPSAILPVTSVCAFHRAGRRR